MIIFVEKKHILKFSTSQASKVSVHTQAIGKMLHLGEQRNIGVSMSAFFLLCFIFVLVQWDMY